MDCNSPAIEAVIGEWTSGEPHASRFNQSRMLQGGITHYLPVNVALLTLYTFVHPVYYYDTDYIAQEKIRTAIVISGGPEILQ